jgi:hypothetical protein
MVSNALRNTSFTKEQKKQIIKEINNTNVYFDIQTNDIRNSQGMVVN